MRLVGMELFGIKFVGLNADNGRKLLLTLGFIAAVILIRWLLQTLAHFFVRGSEDARHRRFWTHQAISLLCAFSLFSASYLSGSTTPLA